MDDVIGIGIGPFNLSLAALLQPTGLRARFLDRKPRFAWHEGMLFPNSSLQVSYLKDCVSLADPTSAYSFLNFLRHHGRLYTFVNRRTASVSRQEFSQYYNWVSEQLPNLQFGQTVVDVQPEALGYRVVTQQREYFGRNLVLGVGIVPSIPECARALLGPRVYHVAELMRRPPPSPGERVLLVGGGQSGAEVAELLLQRSDLGRFVWATRRANIEPMDDSAFTNEAYTPAYNRYFHSLPAARRRHLIDTGRLTSDGVSLELANRIFDLLYERRFVQAADDQAQVFVNTCLEGLRERSDGAFEAVLVCSESGRRSFVEADTVILATGFTPHTPDFVANMMRFAHVEDGHEQIEADYSLKTREPLPGKIYLQNRSRVQHGLQSVNLSLVAHRNAVIVNSLVGEQFYPTQADRPMLSRIEDGELAFMS